MCLLWLLRVIGAAVVATVESLADLLVRSPIERIMCGRRRREQRLNDKYWGLDSYADVARDLAAAGAEARSGCRCLGCERLRDEVATVIFRLNDDDIAELARYGIAWDAS